VRLFKSTDEIKEYILLESEDRQDNLEWYLDRIDFHDLLMKSWDLNHYEGGHQQFEYEGNSDSNSHEHSYEPKVKDDSVDDEDPNE